MLLTFTAPLQLRDSSADLLVRALVPCSAKAATAPLALNLGRDAVDAGLTRLSRMEKKQDGSNHG
jgi:hypothetical protein